MTSNVIALIFDGATTAENMLTLFEDLQERNVVALEDAALASRGVSDQVEIKQTQSVTGKYTLRGTGIGLVAGLLLGGPIGGLAAGAAIGAISGSLKDIGIDDLFINDVSSALGPNSSALFLMGKANDPDEFHKALAPFRARVISTTLSDEQVKQLRATLEREE
jgi:uncharacterized membrane protein